MERLVCYDALAKGSAKVAPAPAPPLRLDVTGGAAAPPLRLVVTAGPDTNQGAPLYVVVRKCDGASFLATDYDTVAGGVFGCPRDPAVVRKAVVRPGEVLRLEVPRDLAEGEVLGVYFLFSMPGERWRFAVTDARVQTVSVVLGAWSVESVEQRP